MTDVGAAEKRLDRAIARLETALTTRKLPLPSSAGLTMTSIAKSEGDDTREEIRDVAIRLDSAIHRLQRTLGE